MLRPELQPCRRFRHMNITPAFLKHLPKCAACQSRWYRSLEIRCLLFDC
jgi:hypothetical protein